jgi:hypothetical protein
VCTDNVCVTTNANGEYTIPRLQTGEYYVSLSVSEGAVEYVGRSYGEIFDGFAVISCIWELTGALPFVLSLTALALPVSSTSPGLSSIVFQMSSSSSEHSAPVSDAPETMLPPRQQRPPLESAFVRIVATGGVVGIGVAVGAILASQHVAGWIIGLVVALISVIVSAVLWSSREV